MDDCQHERFDAEVDVNRVWTGEAEGHGELAFHASVKIRCADCRVRFRFLGLPMGLSWKEPTVDPSGMELQAPIVPDGHTTSMMADLPGFSLRHQPTDEEGSDGD